MFAHIKELFTRPSGYKISRSVRLRSSASAYLQRTPASATSQTTWTWSGWVKRGTLGTSQTFLCAGTSGTQNYTILQFGSDAIQFDALTAGPVVVGRKYTTAVYRDPSAWYHIVAVWDTTNATAASRMRLYVNGQQVTSFSLSTDPSLNATAFVNSTNVHQIGQFNSAGSNYFDGYLTDVNFIDGQALTPSSFGETDTLTGVWKPKKYAGTYGTNGFYLNFSDNSNNTATTIGKDYSGNGNNWTPNNISVTAGVTYDSMLDVPTLYADGGNGRGNYCVMNPLDNDSVVTLSAANLQATSNAGGRTRPTIVPSSGKWYYEVTITSIGTATVAWIGWYPFAAYRQDGLVIVDGANWISYGSSWTTNDVIGIALDFDANTVTFYKNGTSQGQKTSTGGQYSAPDLHQMSSNSAAAFNFGQRPFAYTPPTGFVALNTQNLPTPTISNGANYMAATTFTSVSGSNVVTNTVNGIGFQPDLVWIKARSNAQDHYAIDSVRSGNSLLRPNQTNAESIISYWIDSFNSNGFTTNTTNLLSVGYTYVGWQWRAGGTSSSNTNGSITSTVSVGATQGFSVVTYTGTGTAATVGHGLGVAPKMIFVKVRNNSGDNWGVYHSSIGNTGGLILNLTNATGTNIGYWNNTSPTSSVFSVGSFFNTAFNYVAYCFSEVAGYSKFGSYTGNGSINGPFVFCGFRPRWVMVKEASGTNAATSSWQIFDTSRDTYNPEANRLQANSSSAEGVAPPVSFDIVSNGFKLRDTNPNWNESGGTYIFAAFAETPTKFSLAR